MKYLKSIFVNVFLVCACLCTMPVVAAVSNGCENEDNNRIVPELALCTTHAYNINQTQNPTGSDKQLMKDVIALKTTVMAQQMNKQYEYLEAMIRRFKIQLEKAVLTTSLEAKGAGTSSSSSGGGYPSRNVALGEDCSGKNRTDTVYCLRGNYSKLQQAVASRQYTNEIKEQIVRDANAIRWFDSELKKNLCDGTVDDSKCCFTKAYLDKNTISACLGKINGAIIKIEEGAQKQPQK